jgi:hypothetical protein
MRYLFKLICLAPLAYALPFQNRRGRRVVFRVREAEMQLPRAARRKQFRALAMQHHKRFARFLFQTDTWR